MKNKLLFLVFFTIFSFKEIYPSINFKAAAASTFLGIFPASIVAYKITKNIKQTLTNVIDEKYKQFLQLSPELKAKYFKERFGDHNLDFSALGTLQGGVYLMVFEDIKVSELFKFKLSLVLSCYATWGISSFVLYKNLNPKI